MLTAVELKYIDTLSISFASKLPERLNIILLTETGPDVTFIFTAYTMLLFVPWLKVPVAIVGVVNVILGVADAAIVIIEAISINKK